MAKQINQGGNQMKRKKLMALFMTTAVTASMLTGCGGGASTATDSSASGTAESGSESADNGDITDFTMFIAMPGSEINDGNEIQELIAQKTGVRVKETWLTGQTAERY